MTTTLTKSEQNLIWIDLEMTGLFPDKDRIIEIAVVVTDAQLNFRVEGPTLAVHQSNAALDAMDAWNKGTHGRSGLIDRVKASTLDEAQAEAQIIAFLKDYVPAGRSPMCGNSICQDRRFMANHMPVLESFFHYRNLDVSTLKELAKRWKPAAYNAFKKQQAHTALADVHESIEELAHYRETFLRLTADCPLADPDVIDRVIAHHVSGGFDYTYNTADWTFPKGLDVEVIEHAAFARACAETNDAYDHEHVTPYIYHHPDRFRIGEVRASPPERWRWTVDTPEDFAFVTAVYEDLYPVRPDFRMADILAWQAAQPGRAISNAA